MLVRAGETDLVDLRHGLDDLLAHLVQRVLQGVGEVIGEGVEDDLLDSAVHGFEVEVGGVVDPAGGDIGGQYPVLGLRQSRVFVLRVADEAGFRGLEHGESVEAGDQRVLVAVAGEDGGAHLGGGLIERVVVVVDATPTVFLGLPASAGDPVEARGEVVGQAHDELFGRAHAQFLGLREDRVLLRISGHDVFVVAFGVRGLEIAPQLRGDVEIAEFVALGVAVDPHQSVLRLAVLVRCQSDLAHRDIPPVRRHAGFRTP